MSSKKMITQIPEVLRTQAQEEFFDATLDQLFSAKNTEPLEGFVGRRTGGVFRPQRDKYKTEPTLLRSAYQLEPVSFSGTATDNTVCFYEDLINYLEFRGGDTNNHNRLFSDLYYSFAPPIDIDKFVNYPNYVWIPDLSLLPAVAIKDVDVATEVLDETSVTVPAGQWMMAADIQREQVASQTEADYDGASGNGVFDGGSGYSSSDEITLSNGDIITVDAVDGSGSVTEFTVTTVNGVAVSGTALEQDGVLPAGGTGFELTAAANNLSVIFVGRDQPLTLTSGLPVLFVDDSNWDTVHLVEGVGRSIELIDISQFDVRPTRDHLIIERSVRDLAVLPNRLWSVSNHWVHVGLLDLLTELDSTVFAASGIDRSERSLRPILEFERRLEMFSENQPKARVNVAPRFRVYDWQGTPLDDEDTYPDIQPSDFNDEPTDGNLYLRCTSTLFGYAPADDPVQPDPVLGFAVNTRQAGAVGEIEFDNTLETVSYTYQRLGAPVQPVRGYLFYGKYTSNVISNTEVDLRTMWKSSTAPLKQRVLQRFLGTGTRTQFVIDAVPADGVDSISVSVQGIVLGTDQYSWNASESTVTLSVAPESDAVVEIRVYTVADLESEDAYFEIPANLEKNPDNSDITTTSWNDLNRHFVSIIENQPGFTGTGFGNVNNYRDSGRDSTLGTQILQTQSPLLKTMLTCTNSDLDIVSACRFSRDEYSRYKNKLVKYTQLLINEGFQPVIDPETGLAVTEWLDEAINRVIKSREHTSAFDHTLMLAWSNLYREESATVLAASQQIFALDLFADLSDRSNVLYVYVNGELQTIGEHYNIVSTDNLIQVEFVNPLITLTQVVFRLYEDISSAHIPATPAQLGIVEPQRPRIELDTSLPTPTEMIVGHDGSRTPVYGNIVDQVLLEFETRIYNGLPEQFRTDYNLPVAQAQVRPGWFRETGWSIDQWLSLLKPSFLLWTTQQAADHRVNATWNAQDPWSWNYTGLTYEGRTLTGSWRRIFEDFYDTQTPHLTPWEMLGFTQEPEWWQTEYGSGPWPSNSTMWQDLESGTIRGGSRTGTDVRYARPDLVSDYLPVDAQGSLKATPLLCIGYTGSNPTVDQQQASWRFGDQGPVEQVWRNSAEYGFDLSLALFLGRPAEFGEKLWDPQQFLRAPADSAQTLSNRDPDLRRPKNQDMQVHGELESSGKRIIRSGYQVWISSRLQGLNQDITTEFGLKLRTLGVKLAHRMAGFANPETLKVFVGGISTGSSSRYVLLPDENVTVQTHTSPALREYFYGGVLIRTLENGTYQVYGYDPSGGSFSVVPRVDSNANQTITVGGESESFRIWASGTSYQKSEVVKLNGVFYRALEAHNTARFEPDLWQRLSSLPTVGGVTVTYRPQGNLNQRTTVEYGEVLATAQDVFDFLIGWGQHLEQTGFAFETLNAQNGRLDNWFESANQFLFWVSGSPDANSALALSPASNKIDLTVKEGYPVDLQRAINSVYSIQDRNGVIIDLDNLVVRRSGRQLECSPDTNTPGIYGFRAATAETESIVIVDNVSRFGDVVYDPVLGVRVPRLALKGERTVNWTGRLEAQGFLFADQRLIPNYEHLVDRFRDYHNTETQLSDPAVSAIARHIIGFEDRDYLQNMDIQDNNQYLFYRGILRNKGTVQAIEKIMRARTVSNGQPGLSVREDWALRSSTYGAVCNRLSTEFVLPAREITSDSQMVVVNYDNRNDLDVPPGAVTITGTDDARWVTKPDSGACSISDRLWPEQNQLTDQIPNAGFVHLDDVDYSTFSLEQMFGFWQEPETPTVNPGGVSSLMHVAQTGNDWNVYTVVDDNREVEVVSHFGTLLYESDFQDPSSALISVTIGRDGTVRRSSLVGIDSASDIVLPVNITDLIQEAGSGLSTTRSFPVVFSPDPNSGRGAVLDLTATNGALTSASISALGSGYGKPFTTTFTVPRPDIDFERITVAVTSDKDGKLLSDSLLFVNTGSGYPDNSSVSVPVPGGSNGTIRLDISDTGRLSFASVTNTGSGYAEPAEFNNLNFPAPTSGSAGDRNPVISVASTTGEEVRISFLFRLLDSGEAPFSPSGDLFYRCENVSIDNPTTNGPYTPNSQFVIRGIELGPLLVSPFDDTFTIPLEDVELTVTVNSSGRASSVTINENFVIQTSSLDARIDTFESVGPSNEIILGTQAEYPSPGTTVEASTVSIDEPGTGFQAGTYRVSDQFGGTWDLTVADGSVTAVNLVSAGTGYPAQRTTLDFDYSDISVTEGTTAKFRLTCDSNGQLNSVTITDAGSGYQNGTFTLSDISVNGGSGGSISYTVSGGEITSAQIAEPGSRYANRKTQYVTDNVTEEPNTVGGEQARINVTVDRFGQLSSATVLPSNRGNGYTESGFFDIGLGDAVTLNSGSGGRISYTVNSSGQITDAEIVRRGRNYLQPETRTVVVSSTSVLNRDFVFDINGVDVTFVSRNTNSPDDIVATINAARIPGIESVSMSGERILIRSFEDQSLRVRARSAEEANSWVDVTGIDWFDEQPFELVLRGSATLTVGSQTFSFDAGTTVTDIVNSINDANIDNVQADIRDSRLVITSVFDPDFTVSSNTTAWSRDIGTSFGEYRPARLIRQINSGNTDSLIPYQPGLVEFNRRLSGTENPVIRRSFTLSYVGDGARTQFPIGDTAGIVSVTVDGVDTDYTVSDGQLVLSDAPAMGARIEMVARYRVEDSGRLLTGKVLVEDPANLNNFTLFDYEFVGRGSLDQWYYVLSDTEGIIDNNRFNVGDQLPTTELRTAVFVSLKFDNLEHYEANRFLIEYSGSPLFWVEHYDNSGAAVFTTAETPVLHRQQSTVINSGLLRNAYVYDRSTLQTLLQLPVYDPLKNLLPGPAERNISYHTPTDPARYTNSSDSALIDPSAVFDNRNVGELWWDTSTVAYYWYEQGDNSYRRDNWGRIVPGSSIDIYEWTRCLEPPANYQGDGEPRNTTDYVESRELDPIQQRARTYYYYWVKNRTSEPDTQCSMVGRSAQRTLSSSEVTRLIEDPVRQNYRWFAAVSDTGFVFSGIDRIFADNDTVFQINYARRDLDLLPHTEWKLVSQDDPYWRVDRDIWNKMVDSVCEITGAVDLTGDQSFGYTLDNYPDAITIGAQSYLPVPAAGLSETQRLGIGRRPRQTMFDDAQRAREVFVRTVNQALETVRVRDVAPGWAQSLDTGTLWSWQDWWAPGRNRRNSVPVKRVDSLAQLQNLENLTNGDVILVQGIGLGARRSLYEYDAENVRFELLYRENTRLVLSSDIYTSDLTNENRVQLRNVMTSLADNVFVDEQLSVYRDVFFAMIRHAFTEQVQLDWAFKTTYISVRQPGSALTQTPLLVNEVTESTIDYVNEVKPYRSKLRNYVTVRSPETEQLIGTISELSRNQKITMNFDRFVCSLSVVDIRIARSIGLGFSGEIRLNRSRTYEGGETYTIPSYEGTGVEVSVNGQVIDSLSYTVTDDGTTTTVTLQSDIENSLDSSDEVRVAILEAVLIRTGAAGRVAATQVDLWPQIPNVLSRDFEDFFTETLPVTDSELEAVAEINRRVIRQMRCEFEGITHLGWGLIPTVPWDFLSWNEYQWDGSAEPLITDHDAQNPDIDFVIKVDQTQVSYVNQFTGGTGHQADDVITLSNSAQILVVAVSSGAVTEFVVQSAGQKVLAGDELTQSSTTGTGEDFVLTPLGNNLAAVFQDAVAIEQLPGNGLQTIFEPDTEYPDYLWDILVDGVPQIRNIDYFVIDGSLVFEQAPPEDSVISVFVFIDAGPLRNPQVNPGIADEQIPLQLLSTLSINVNRLEPTP